MNLRGYRSFHVVVGIAGLSFLTACGTSPPPLDELTHEIIDSTGVEPDVKACMHKAFDEFKPTVGELEAANLAEDADLAAVFERANEAEDPPPTNETGALTSDAEYDQAAQAIVDRLQVELAACNT